MTKINIAELLKDCPQGMELDCTMFDNVTFVGVDNNRKQFPIEIKIGGLHSKYLTKEGCFHDTTLLPESKCVIFPKGKTTWEGFVPPCQFKDGDVISNLLGTCIFKGEGRIKGTVDYYCGVVHPNYFNVKDKKFNPDKHYGNIVDYRFATEEEKQKLFDAIKANGYKWNAETTTLEKLIEPKFKVGDVVKSKLNVYTYKITQLTDTHYTMVCTESKLKYTEPISEDENWKLVADKFDISTLKPFESRVLVRDNDKEKWKPAMWGFYDEDYAMNYPYVVGSTSFRFCIPYEENEHLLGTTNDCDKFYKTWIG